MNILYYTWGENSTEMSVQALKGMGHNVLLFADPVDNKLRDEVFEEKLIREIEKEKIDVVFTYNYFPCITRAVEKTDALYVSWIYDNPHYTVYAKTAFSDSNRIFHFDHAETEKLKAAGVKNVFHMPLGVPKEWMGEADGLSISEDDNKFKYDVSFVGSLYNGKGNLYDRINYLPPYEKGFFESIINTQRTVCGIDFASELITEEVYGRIAPHLELDMGEDFFVTQRDIFINMLQRKITSVERVDLLRRAGESFDVTLFSGDTDESLSKVHMHGYISHDTELPRIYKTSKINLNITLRSITSGIPLRCMEVMSCGGFLLTNYQPELAQYFTDGEELAMFSTPDEMMEKIGYYLSHEEERIAIAKRGQQKVRELFSLEKCFGKIFKISLSDEPQNFSFETLQEGDKDSIKDCDVQTEQEKSAINVNDKNRQDIQQVPDNGRYVGSNDNSAILVIYGVTYCYNILNNILENFGKALERRGERVEYYDEQAEGVAGLAQYIGREFKAVIGVQTYLYSIFLKDAGCFLFDGIKGPRFNIVLDHPGWLRQLLAEVPENTYVLTHDTNYIEFIKKYYPKTAGSFLLPPGGMDNPYLDVAKGQPASEDKTGAEYDLVFIGTYGDFRKKCEQIRECNPFAKKLALKYLIMLKRYVNEPAEKVFALTLGELGIEVRSDEEFLTLFAAMNPVVQLVMYYYREKTLRTLAEAGIDVDVWGETWQNAPFMKASPYKEHIHVRGDLTPDEAEKILAESRMALNIMAWHKAGFTERLANTMLSGTVMLSDSSTYIREHFKCIDPQTVSAGDTALHIRESEFAVFDLGEMQSLPQFVKTLFADKAALADMARCGRQRCIEEHTWDVRAKEFLDICSKL